MSRGRGKNSMRGTSNLRRGSGSLGFLLTLLSMLGCCNGRNGEILVGPMSQLVPLGSTSDNFTCHGKGDDVFWIINNTYCVHESSTATINNLTEQGFLFYWPKEHTPITFRLTMTVMAALSINTTEIKCRAEAENTKSSEVAKLIVIGAPSPPEPHLEVVNATWILVSWETPFTWPDYEELHYNITMTNTSSGVVTYEIVSANETFFTRGEIIAQSCTELIFTVSASSALGWSNPGTVSGGFPISPQPFTSPVTIDVHFKSDGTPEADAIFELPYTCFYQNLNYTIIIHNLATNQTSVIGPQEHYYANGTSVSKTITISMINVNYFIAVNVSTLSGTMNSNRTYFDTYFNPTVPTTDLEGNPTVPTTDPEGSTIDRINTVDTNDTIEDSTFTHKTSNNSMENQEPVLIVAISVGAVVPSLVVASAIIIMVVMFIRKEKPGGKHSTEKAQSAMVPNPIYEGPLYEIIAPENFDVLVNADQEQESRYLDNPILPAKSGEATVHVADIGGSEIIPIADNDSAPTDGADNYTVMSPIGSHTFSKMMSKTEFSENCIAV